MGLVEGSCNVCTMASNQTEEERSMGIGQGFPYTYLQWARFRMKVDRGERQLPDDFPTIDGLDANWDG